MEFNLQSVADKLGQIGLDVESLSHHSIKGSRGDTSVSIDEKAGRVTIEAIREAPRVGHFADFSTYHLKSQSELISSRIWVTSLEGFVSARASLPDGFLEVDYVLSAVDLVASTAMCACALLVPSPDYAQTQSEVLNEKALTENDWEEFIQRLTKGERPPTQ